MKKKTVVSGLMALGLSVYMAVGHATQTKKEIELENCKADERNRCVQMKCALSSDISERPNCQSICASQAKVLCEAPAPDSN